MGDFSKLANRIKELRQSLRMTQREFAKKAGCTAATLSAYENGSKSPSLEIVKGIAEAFNVSIDWLCGLSDEEKDKDSIKTYADLIKLLLKIQNLDLVTDKFVLQTVGVRDSFTGDYDYKHGLFTDSEKMHHIIHDINKMQAVLNDGTISEEIFNTWLDGFLEKHDTPLITWDSISEKENEGC